MSPTRTSLAAVAPHAAAPIDFDGVYRDYFDFIWRNLQRLGVPHANVDDALQEVFVVVHRKLSEFEQRSSLKTWIGGIVVRVAADHRRTLRRKRNDAESRAGNVEIDTLADTNDTRADERVAQRQAAALLHRLLDELDSDKRSTLVLVELEQMTIPEAAEALGINLNTAYARLRSARQSFERALKREQARTAGGLP